MRWYDFAPALLLFSCVGDAPIAVVPPDAAEVDAAGDAKALDGGAADAPADAPKETEGPCIDGGPVVVNGASGVQCEADGGSAFCSKGLSSCCVGSGKYQCALHGNCGTQLEYACDQSSDCKDAGVCCLKAPNESAACGGRILSSQGSYCAPTCPTSDIKLCGGSQSECFNKTCRMLQLTNTPGKRVSGCL